jgi:hypothetical protein
VFGQRAVVDEQPQCLDRPPLPGDSCGYEPLQVDRAGFAAALEVAVCAFLAAAGLRICRILMPTGPVDEIVIVLNQLEEEAMDRGEVAGLFFRSGSQAPGCPERLGHRAVEVGFLS